jgi:hypothetical protein
MIDPQLARSLPENIWRALLLIHSHVDTLPIDIISKRILTDGIENLSMRLAEASKQNLPKLKG